MKNFFTKTVAAIRKLAWFYQVGGAVVIVALVVVVAHAATGSSAATDTTTQTTHVTIASVASLSDQAGPLPLTGTVSSVSKASILAVSSGEIVSLSRSLGDHVAAGSVIASFENSSQRAAVLQAQGAYDAAQAALAKASGSTAQNSDLTSAQAAQNAQNAAAAASSALQSAYTSLDDALHTKADALFSNPHSDLPALNLTVPDSQLVTDIQNQRVALDDLVASVNALGSDQVAADVDANITTAITKAQTLRAFLDEIVEALNKAVITPSASASTIAGYQTSIAAARTEVVSAISTLTATKTTYDSAASNATVSQNSASSAATNDIASAQANVKSALGALDAAEANLEKTIIRSPISGTIVSLPITQGGYVASFSQVAQVSNPGALEIDTYVTSDDAKTLAVGGKAIINGTTDGVIVFIAPALDPTTGKIQVKIGISGDQSALTDGDTVSVTLARSATGGATTSSKTAITIPIVAAKITPSGPVVFTVSSSTLISHQIVFGDILGGQVTVTSGLTSDMDIVTDARGLSDGQTVVVDTTQ